MSFKKDELNHCSNHISFHAVESQLWFNYAEVQEENMKIDISKDRNISMSWHLDCSINLLKKVPCAFIKDTYFVICYALFIIYCVQTVTEIV